MVAAGLRRTDRVVHCLNYQLWTGGVTDHLILEAAGATVVPFGVGNTRGLIDAIRDLGDRQPGVLLQDIQDTGVDGIEFIRQGVSPIMIMAK